MPHGVPLSAADLEDTKMVVVLPPHDYPSELADVELYDEAWTTSEATVSSDDVDNGGLLVLTDSAARLGPFGRPREANEDWGDLNLLAQDFGIEHGDAGGEVIALGDVGILISQSGQPSNFTFWQNLARYSVIR